MDGNALAILQSHPATDDPGLFNELHRMATQNPVNFGKQNLLAQSGALSRAHMQTLLSLQDAVNKQDPQAIQAGKRIDMTVNALMGNRQTAAAGDESANAGTDIHPSGDQADKLEAGLRDHLLAAQQSDPKLTLDDLYGTGASYLKDWSR